MFSAGFRPFFLLAAAWAAIAVPVWLAAYAQGYALPGAVPAILWHGHEMVFGFGVAAVAGFLLTAIPNWTGRLPVRGWPLAVLALLWLSGRIAMLVPSAALLDLAFLAALVVVVARELLAGRNWRNLPMLGGLLLLFAANLLLHLGIAAGLRLGIATLLMLIALVGGRIVPSFTRNWLAKHAPRGKMPAPESTFDRAALVVTLAALAAWVADLATWPLIIAGLVLAGRLSRWRGGATFGDPLLLVLHAGYGWLAFGLVLLGLSELVPALPASTALHALTVGAIGTMTLAVMTRASLGHSGRALAADAATRTMYLLVTLAALLRLASAFAGNHALLVASLAGLAWTAAFALFAVHYGPLLVRERRVVPA
jgi:uncharacterized protein involved in response to NO